MKDVEKRGKRDFFGFVSLILRPAFGDSRDISCCFPSTKCVFSSTVLSFSLGSRVYAACEKTIRSRTPFDYGGLLLLSPAVPPSSAKGWIEDQKSEISFRVISYFQVAKWISRDVKFSTHAILNKNRSGLWRKPFPSFSHLPLFLFHISLGQCYDRI